MMKNITAWCLTKPLAVYLAIALVALSTFAGPAEAMFVPSAPDQAAVEAARAADLVKIRTALESKIVQQRLMDYGLSSEEAMARMAQLSDQQLHDLASRTDAIQAGGDAVGFVVGVLIVAILVVVLVYLVQGRIVVK